MSSTTITQRRNVFIKKSFQGRFIAMAFLLIAAASVFSSLLIYWLIGSDLHAQGQSAHASISNASQRLVISLLVGNLVSVLVAGAAAGFAVLYASHKIAGPLYRFEVLCEQIGSGNYDGVIRLRNGDQLQALAEAFAAMLAGLRATRERQAAMATRLQWQLLALCAADNLTGSQRAALGKMADALASIPRGSGEVKDSEVNP